jgi:hypothetical protein
MADDAKQRPDDLAWDRAGRFFEDMGSVAQGIWNRNLGLWSGVSQNVRGARKYGADEMAGDAAKALAAAMDNLDDIWTAATRMPERLRVAAPVPSAFLLFALKEDGRGHALAETVSIRVPAGELENMDDARIALFGPPEGVEVLANSLRVTREPGKGYLLQAAGEVPQVPGTYNGAVYVGGTHPRALADLHVVVEGTPAAGRAKKRAAKPGTARTATSRRRSSQD